MLKNKDKKGKKRIPIFLLVTALALGGVAALQSSAQDYRVDGAIVTAYANEVTTDTWDGATVDTSWYNETDTSFEISTCAQLAGLAELVRDGNSFEGKTFTQTAHLNLDSKAWTPIGWSMIGNYFNGTYDGGFLDIMDISIDSENSNQGLFDQIDKNGTVKNVNLQYGSIKTTGHSVGAIAAINNGTIENCYVDIEITVAGSDIGGIVGCSGSTGIVKNCINGGIVKNMDTAPGGISVGGIVGCNQGMVISCLQDGNVYFGEEAGGAFVGYNQGGTVKNCVAESSVYGGVFVGQSIDHTEEGLKAVYDLKYRGRGEAVWYLNGGNSDGDWGADLSSVEYEIPVLKVNGGKTVYQVKNCLGETAYNNANEDLGHEGELCSVCNTYFLLLTYEYVSETDSYTVTGADTSTESWTALASNTEAQANIHIVIPDTYNDGTNGEKAVAVVAELVFSNFFDDLAEGYTVRSLTLGNNLTEIGEHAFNCADANATHLFGELVIPASVKTIGAGAFMNNGFTSVVLNEGLETIGDDAFIRVPLTGVLHIPESVTAIGFQAFFSSQLAVVYLSENTNTTYGEFVFNSGNPNDKETWPIVVAHSKEAYAIYTAEGHKLGAENNWFYLTYETEVTFVTDPTVGDDSKVQMTKLYNMDATYVKGADGVWKKDAENAFPEVTIPDRMEFIGWNTIVDGSGEYITDGVLTWTDAWFPIFENAYVCETHPGFYYTSLNNGKHKAICTNSECGYSEEISCEYSSSRTDSTATSLGYYTYTCENCYHSYDDDYFCDHVDATYAQIYDNETPTKTHSVTCNVPNCPDGGVVPTEDCSFTEERVYSTETEMGYYTYTCNGCGYSYDDDYFCDHIGATYTQVYDGEEYTLTHSIQCNVEDCGYEAIENCYITRQPMISSEGEKYIWIGCVDCDYGVKENYVCLHLGAEYTQNYEEDGETGTWTHTIVCDVCGETIESEECTLQKLTSSNGIGEYVYNFCLYCEYEEEVSYECYHEYGVSYEQVYYDETATWTHTFVCESELCEENGFTEKCSVIVEQIYDEDSGSYYNVTYCVWCGYEEIGEFQCQSGFIYTQIYEEDGVTATGMHMLTCTEGCVDNGIVADCKYKQSDYAYSEDGLTIIGIYYECIACYYSYLVETEVEGIAYINGVALTLETPYYVNGENGAAGTVYAEEPETWNAKLEMGEYEGEYVLTINGLNVVTDGSVAFAIEYTEDLEIVLKKGSENVLMAKAPELGSTNEYYGGIGPKDSNALDLNMSGEGTLTITVEDEQPDSLGRYYWSAAGIYSIDDSYIEDVILNITLGTSYSSSGLSIGDNFEARDATFTIVVNSNGDYAYGIEGEDDTEFYDCLINIELGGKVAYSAYGIDSDDYLMVFDGCEVTIKVETETEAIYGIQSGDGGDEQVSFIIKDSIIDITLGDAIYYMVGIKADDDDENYFDMGITGSEISIVTGDVVGEFYSELYGIWGSLGSQVFKDNKITIELGDCLYGGIGGIVPERNYDYAYADTTIEDCEISIVTGDAGEWNIGIEASRDVFTIKNSTITIELGDGTLLGGGDYYVGALVGDEDFTITDSVLDLTVGDGYYTYGIAAWSDGLVIKNSEIDIVVGNGLGEVYGIYASEEYGEREALTIQQSVINIEYGAAEYAYGIYAEIDWPDSDYNYGALLIKDSTVNVAGLATMEDESMSYESVAIYVEFSDYYAEFSDLICIENSNVSASAGSGMESAGMKIDAYTEDYGYIENGLYIVDSTVILEGGLGIFSVGVDIEIEYLGANYGLCFENSDVTIKSGMGMYVSVGVGSYFEYIEYAPMYIDDGNVSVIAYDIYEDEETLRLLLTMMSDQDAPSMMMGMSYGAAIDYIEIEDGEFEVYGSMVSVMGYVEYDYDKYYMFANTTYSMEGANITFFDAMDHPYPYVRFIKATDMPPVYIGGVALELDQYYVNGENGGAGKVYSREPEEWNAYLTYDEENKNYVLTLNGLYVVGQANSVWSSAIVSYENIEIVLVEGSENVIVASESMANGRNTYAIETYTYDSHEVIEEYEGFFVGALTLTGKGSITLVGALANTELVWDFETYVWKISEEDKLVYSEVEELELNGEENYLTIGYHAHEKGEFVEDETQHWYVCVGCEELLEKADHSYDSEWLYDDEGHWKTCECGAVGEKTAHAYGSWRITKPATETEEGLREKVCDCGHTVEQGIILSPNTPVQPEKPNEPDQPDEPEVEIPPKTSEKDGFGLDLTTFNCSGSIGGLGALTMIGVAMAMLIGKKRKDD